jgi:hypothetical protein
LGSLVKTKKAFLRTGWLLTIACHIKSYFFRAVSDLAAVSAGIGAVVSGIGATVVLVSTVTDVAVSVVVVSSSDVSLHAAKAPIANTKRSFFILPVLIF